MRKKFRSVSLLTTVLLTLLLLPLALFWRTATPPVQAAAGVNKTINFQGKLTNTNGTNIADGTYNLEFKIVQDGDGCNPTSGTFPCSGTVEWTETRLVNSSQRRPIWAH